MTGSGLTARALLAAFLLPVAVSCSTSSPSEPPGAPLAPADQVEASRAARAAVVVPFGALGELPGHLAVTISSPKPGGDADGPWLVVKARVENRSDSDAPMPQIGILCARQAKHGSYQSNSTLSLAAQVPAGSYREGLLYLLLPGDGRFGAAIPACQPPAFVEALPLAYVDNPPPSIRVPLSVSVVTALNARR